MTTEALCKLVIDEFDHGTLQRYKDVLLQESIPDIPDPFWQAAANLARWLSPEERELLLALMRRAAVDMSSSLLGVIDGNTALAEKFTELSLTDAQGHRYKGQLKDTFVRLAEATSGPE